MSLILIFKRAAEILFLNQTVLLNLSYYRVTKAKKMTSILKGVWCFFLLIFSFSVSAKSPVCPLNIEVTAPIVPPLVELNQGEISGDITKMVQKVLFEHVEISKLTTANWARVLKLAQNGAVDAIFPAMYSEERALYLDYSVLKLSDVSVTIYSHKTASFTNVKLTSQNTIAIPREVHYNKAMLNGATVFEVARFEHAVKMLEADRVDYVVGVSEVVDYLISQQQLTGIKAIKKLGTFPVYLALSKKSPNYKALKACLGSIEPEHE